MAGWRLDNSKLRRSMAAVPSRWSLVSLVVLIINTLLFVSGCTSGHGSLLVESRLAPVQATSDSLTVSLAGYHDFSNEAEFDSTSEQGSRSGEAVTAALIVAIDSLADLESLAKSQNPSLRVLQKEATAAYAKARFIGKLQEKFFISELQQ